jgi:hypothetical protein
MNNRAKSINSLLIDHNVAGGCDLSSAENHLFSSANYALCKPGFAMEPRLVASD